MNSNPPPHPGRSPRDRPTQTESELLNANAGPLEPPIRSVLFGPARFEQHGHSLAKAHEVVSGTGSGARFFPRLQSNIEMLQRSREQLELRAADGRHLGPAAHWLLDNATLIDEQLYAIRRGLPRSFFRLLPRLRDEPLEGLPRIYGVAWAWVAHTDSGFDAALLSGYLRAYQAERELSLAELWALPTTLRVVLVENLRRLAERSATQQAARDAAHRWFDSDPGLEQIAELDAMEPAIKARGVHEAFLLQLEQRQDELQPDVARALEAWLSTRLPSPATSLLHQQNETTEDQQSIRNAIMSLRLLDKTNWRELIAGTSAVMQILQTAPVYAAEGETTQDETLHAVERLARRSGRSEATVAEVIVGLTRTAESDAAAGQAGQDAAAATPSYWCCGPGRAKLHEMLGLPAPWRAPSGIGRRGLFTLVYLGSLFMFTLASVAWLMRHEATAFEPTWLVGLTSLLLLGPVSEAAVALVNRLISESVPPKPLPRLAFAQGVPAEHQTLVVMPVMFGHERDIAPLCAQLEQHYLANSERHAQFALLSDYVDADTKEQPNDAALLDAAQEAIALLNLRYPNPAGEPLRFLLMHRERQWCESEQRCIGWERKRGKLEQLVSLLAEPGVTPFIDLGALSTPAANTRYIVTLDADTDMPPGQLRKLVGIAAHPLNLPRVDAKTRRVMSGYAILQPRVITPLPAPSDTTPFHQLFNGNGGIDPYSAASSEIYQDLFGEGTFTGKGLMNVQAMHAVLDNRLPEDQVLSHDLLEGSIARCGAVTDVAFMEDAPVHPDVAASRIHRWTRGDWQLLPFLSHAGKYGLVAINRWKMLDNLRRSAVAPMSLALILLVLATGVLPLHWALFVVAAAFSIGPILGAVAGLAPSRDDVALKLFYRRAGGDLFRAVMLAVWHGAQLLQMSIMYVDAIARALYRSTVSRRHLLQWTTAAQAQAAARTDLPALLRQHRRVPIAAAVLGVALGAASLLGAPVQAGEALALLLIWAASPLWTWIASHPRHAPIAGQMDDSAKAYLQDLARDTWRFYEQYIGPDDNHLPPDNVQQNPNVMVAHRTSPTNIGLYLLSVACARELGFIGRATMTERMEATLATMEKLARWNGHFYNWYDTQSLAVLTPSYVSSVDSGNCSGHLLAVARACEGAAEQTDADAESIVREAVSRSLQRMRALQPVLVGTPALHGLAKLAEGGWTWPQDAEQLLELETRVQEAHAELDALHLRWGDSSERGSMWLLHDLVSTLKSALHDQREDRLILRARLLQLAQRFHSMALEADFSPLYDKERRLLHIGYRAEAQAIDDNHYDLLASESRLTSLLAIAKGDVPVEHWAALGRPFFAMGTEVGLKSWSGSMFEYLMPALVLNEPHDSALGQMARSAVAEQRSEGERHGTPWGISESAIAGQDHTLAYQYGPQGAARLALRRIPADERVLAPYATVLAAMVAPCAAVENLRALQALGARHAMGFIEALDYTPQRQTAGKAFTLVETHMTHHQSMSLVAITHLLANGAPRRWAMSDPHLRAVAPLLHERAPSEVARLAWAEPTPQPRVPRSTRLVLESTPLEERLPLTQLLTNGRYAVMLRSHGGGHSNWSEVGVTRWRDDVLRDAHGSFFYLQRSNLDEPWHSITAHPAPDPAAQYDCRMQADRVIFDAHWPDVHARCSTWVSPEDDCEMRQIELNNLGERTLTLRLAACFEATLAPQGGDEAHPAFSNMFVQERWDADERALYMNRRPRLTEEAVHAVHFLANADGAIDSVTPCTDRARWLGRYGSTARPLGDAGCIELPADGAKPGVPMDTGLDPLAGLIVKLQLPPGASIKLTFCTAAAREPETLDALVDKYRQANHVERAASMSHTMAGIRLRELQFDPDTWAAMLLVNTLVTSQTARDPSGAWHTGMSGNVRCDRQLLWRYGISGDRPILWVAISGEEGLGLVQTLKKAIRLWSAAGMGIDLVVSNGEPPSYLSPVQDQLQQLQARQQAQNHDRPDHLCAKMHLLRDQDLSVDERFTLHTLARLKLLADGRPLAQQMERWIDEFERGSVPIRTALQRLPVADTLPRQRKARVDAPLEVTAPEGSFNAEDGSFSFELSPARRPSKPWVNVLANPDFGCQVSELAGGFTWAGNSRMHQLTPWSNDPLSDPAGEWLLLHDIERGRVWALGRRLNERAAAGVEHGIGFTRITQHIDDLEITLTWCVDEKASLKQVQVDVRVETGPRRKLRLVAMAEWVLGSDRRERLSLTTRPQWLSIGPEGAGLPQPGRALALQATQLDHLGGFGGATAFLSLRPPQANEHAASDIVILQPDDWTCDRREFFDKAGQIVLPAALSQRSGSGMDACAALGALMNPTTSETASITVLLGHGRDAQAAQALLADAWQVDPSTRLKRQRDALSALLGGVKVRTPDARFDALVNHWLPYQTLACRMWARAGFYQAGGAFGFRDQLQDALALTTHAPVLLAQQIRMNAARQFPEGDVQHWWHEPSGAGVRTHFSDDRLWLPYALAHYVKRTGDLALLDETQPFLIGKEVPAGAEDIYETPGKSDQLFSLYEHAARAIDRSLAVGVGAHGLPLFGTGDWNDGMNRVGFEGRGESVWLAWFLCRVVDDFLPIAVARRDEARVRAWQAAHLGWARALDAQGWDGRWYLRGFFDDGSPLGSSTKAECSIDLIAQAWAVMSGAGEPARAKQAMASAASKLIDTDQQLVRLLDPPLQHDVPNAGYIQAYPPGVRENGGQYNHGAVWALMALAQLGEREAMWQVFTSLSPAHRWLDAERGATYAIEPYVMAGDVYTQAPWIGRGGWSWYTGSAGWLLRAAVESMCGVVLCQGRITVRPCLPAHWPTAEVQLRHQDRWYRVIVCADQPTLEKQRALEPKARLAQVGQAVDLNGWPEGSVLLVVAKTDAEAPIVQAPAVRPASGEVKVD